MRSSPQQGVQWLNALPAHHAEHELMTCCGSRTWAHEVARRRPYASPEALREAADAAFAGLSWGDVEEALGHHPRIGDRPRGVDRESDWSRGEQAGVIDAAADVTRGLHDGNVAYEKRFGHVFLICATGLSAGEMLDALTRRLANDDTTEREVVRGELLKIAQLRLAKLLERP